MPEKLKEKMQFMPIQKKMNMVIHDGHIVKLLITQGALEKISDSPKLELVVGYGPSSQNLMSLKRYFRPRKFTLTPGNFNTQLK